MAAAIAEPPHLAADLKALHLSTVAAQWQPLAEQAEAFGFNQRYLEDLGPQAVSVFPTDANAPQTGQTGIGQFLLQQAGLFQPARNLPEFFKSLGC